MTKPHGQRLPESTSMYSRECAFDDLVAALFYDAITESEFMRRATHEFDLDYYDAAEIVVQARTAEQGNA